MTIEIELGVTGGEEDGVDNTDIDTERLYTQPEEVNQAYEVLTSVSNRFTVAAAFGNVHGVYKPGNVELTPKILLNSQQFVKDKHGLSDRPIHFVFHGGSGSSREQIREAIGYGVVKMNLDTDMQWAFWDGVHGYYNENKDFLQGQLGNPDGDDKPNKKYYDPRAWLRSGETAFVERLTRSFEDLNCINRNSRLIQISLVSSIVKMSISVLDQLKEHTTVVADTGDFDSIKQYSPRDATTNPSLILKASQTRGICQHWFERLLIEAKLHGKTEVEQVTDQLLVQFGLSILEVVPGRVSTEVDARLIFRLRYGSLEKARSIISFSL